MLDLASGWSKYRQAAVRPEQPTAAFAVSSPLRHWRIVLQIMIDTLTNEEWVALLCIARGVSVRRIPKPVRLRLKAMLLITRDRAGLALTEDGEKFLLLGA
jgi:hypothetical protein